MISKYLKAFLPIHISELREQILQKIYQLIANTRRIGNRAEVMRKIKTFLRPYFSESGSKRFSRWNYFHAVLEEG